MPTKDKIIEGVKLNRESIALLINPFLRQTPKYNKYIRYFKRKGMFLKPNDWGEMKLSARGKRIVKILERTR